MTARSQKKDSISHILTCSTLTLLEISTAVDPSASIEATLSIPSTLQKTPHNPLPWSSQTAIFISSHLNPPFQEDTSPSPLSTKSSLRCHFIFSSPFSHLPNKQRKHPATSTTKE